MARSNRHKSYPTDLTDSQWAVLEPSIPDAKPGGRPRKADKRRIVEAILYQLRAGSAVSGAYVTLRVQLDIAAQFQGMSSSRRSLGWPAAIASRVVFR
jgi:hypothetical protein